MIILDVLLGRTTAIACHCSAAFAWSYSYLDRWDCSTAYYWWIFSFCSPLPFLFELAIALQFAACTQWATPWNASMVDTTFNPIWPCQLYNWPLLGLSVTTPFSVSSSFTEALRGTVRNNIKQSKYQENKNIKSLLWSDTFILEWFFAYEHSP